MNFILFTTIIWKIADNKVYEEAFNSLGIRYDSKNWNLVWTTLRNAVYFKMANETI